MVLTKLPTNLLSSSSVRLSRATNKAVRNLLFQRYPHTFYPNFLSKHNEADGGVQSLGANGTGTTNTNDGLLSHHNIIDQLAGLNGYKQVRAINEQSALAEGVVAVQNQSWMKHYTVYSRPGIDKATSLTEPTSNVSSKNTLPPLTKTSYRPPFREEDFTLYRILETRLDDHLNNRKAKCVHFLKTNPLSKVLENLRMQLMKNNMLNQSDNHANEVSSVEESDQDIEQANIESEETDDLLILSQNNVVIVEEVSPNNRLLALPSVFIKSRRYPYTLKHNGASTILYGSFVTFAAIPLAYRSIRYAMDYPALIELLLASFIGTCAYSIWNSRYGARVRQQLCIEQAVGCRIVARDDAALRVLVDGAVSNVTDLVLKEYRDRLQPGSNQRMEPCSTKQMSEVERYLWGSMGIDSITIAKEVGLLINEEKNTDGLVARDETEALRYLEQTK
jgi:hypothetical protein